MQLESFQLAASAPRDVGLHRVVQAGLDGANKRFLAATRTLALIHKLLAQTNARDSAAQKEPAAPREEGWPDLSDPARPRASTEAGPSIGSSRMKQARSPSVPPECGRPPGRIDHPIHDRHHHIRPAVEHRRFTFFAKAAYPPWNEQRLARAGRRKCSRRWGKAPTGVGDRG